MNPSSPVTVQHKAVLDPRAQRTRSALFGAFKTLVLERPYDQLRVEDILVRAAISRSTFYQHFEGKDDLLTQSMTPLLRVLASPVGNPDRQLGPVLDHFWQNRRFAEAILTGPAGVSVTDHLARLHQQTPRAAGKIQPRTERRLASRAAAHAQIGILLDWLTGRVHADTDVVAATLKSHQRN